VQPGRLLIFVGRCFSIGFDMNSILCVLQVRYLYYGIPAARPSWIWTIYTDAKATAYKDNVPAGTPASTFNFPHS
ncbi:hypothetical protein LJB97_05585, partial [Parabacteroides sp. OttesenSCG-928-O15]|nr:hypothetical protein [Parabacteroides sp. OttesenSCG-928-O15]